MHVVLSLGGSLINPNGTPDVNYLKKISEIIMKSKYDFGIVCGGGRLARVYANTVRQLQGTEFMADEVAIGATRQNAALLIAALGNAAYPHVSNNFDDAMIGAMSKKVVVMGGTIPGITTDTDAVLLAEKLRAIRLVNISNVEAIYDSDPLRNPRAQKFDRMTHQQLVALANESDRRKAGEHFVFDVVACKLLARSKIEAHFVSGKRLHDVANAINGKKHGGTVISAANK